MSHATGATRSLTVRTYPRSSLSTGPHSKGSSSRQCLPCLTTALRQRPEWQQQDSGLIERGIQKRGRKYESVPIQIDLGRKCGLPHSILREALPNLEFPIMQRGEQMTEVISIGHGTNTQLIWIKLEQQPQGLLLLAEGTGERRRRAPHKPAKKKRKYVRRRCGSWKYKRSYIGQDRDNPPPQIMTTLTLGES